MTTISEYNELPIPTWALCYLVNADASGLEDGEQEMVDKYMEQFYKEAKEKGGHVIFSPEADENGENKESYFTWNPEFGLACDVEDCTVLIVK